MASAREERRVGAHHFVYEAPDALHGRLDGPLSVEEAAELVQVVKELGAKYGPLVVCTDVSRFKTSGQRVRQVVIGEMTAHYPVRACIILGASFPVRIAMTMVVKAAKHISPGLFAFPVEFVANESEARALMEAYRNPAPSARGSSPLLQTGS